MPTTQAAVRALIEAELAEVADRRVVAHIRAMLVEPYAVGRTWSHETPARAHTCWTVLEDSGLGVAYCPAGPGPRWHWPWGLVFLKPAGDTHDMGTDNCWYGTFLEAYREM